MTIDTSALIANAGKLNKCVKKSEELKQDTEKDNLLYSIIKAKVTKKRHNFITFRDATLKKCKNLLKNGADPSKLELSEEDLKTLSPTQKAYYFNFLGKLHKEIKKIILKIESEEKKATSQSEKTHCSVERRESNDSAYESGSDIESGDNSISDIVPSITESDPIPSQHLKQSQREEPKSEEKTSNAKTKKRFKGLSIRRIGRETGIRFVRFNEGGKAGIRKAIKSIGQLLKREHIKILQSDTNPYHILDSKDNESNCASTSENAETQISSEIKNDSECLLEIKKKDEKQFKDHLESYADITIHDEKGNNILHRIALLEGKKKCKFLDELTKCEKTPQENLVQLINSTNKDGKNPLQIALIAKIKKGKHKYDKPQGGDNTLKFIIKLLELGAEPNQLEFSKGSLKELSEEQKRYYRNFLEKLAELVKKSKLDKEVKDQVIIKTAQIIDDGYPLHLAIRDGDKNKFNQLLKSGYDITIQNEEGNNALHRIALLPGEQKVTYLSLILDLVEKAVIPKDKSGEAIKARNSDGYTPIQVALINKIKKEKHKFINPKSCDNTIKFCAMLLENGANPNDLKLTKELHNKEHYRFLRKLEQCDSIPQKIREEITTTRKYFKNKHGYQSKTKKFFKSAWEFMDPAKRTRELLTITVTTTVITMVALAFFQGQIAIEAAIPIIAVAAVMCLIFTLGFSPIKKFFEKSLTNREDVSSNENTASSTAEQKQAQDTPTEKQNLENEPENPDTKIDNVSIINQLVNCFKTCTGFSKH